MTIFPSKISILSFFIDSFFFFKFQWILGNYSKAFLCLLGEQVSSLNNKSALLSNRASFTDPNVGQYCLMLTTKNQMKNAIGEQNTTILGRWAVLMSSSALSRCGLPVCSHLYTSH